MKKKIRHITSNSIHIFMIIFWLFVATDKLWNLEAFHSALLKQPFPSLWADTLYWSLPIGELIIGLLFIGQYRRWAYLLSAILLLIFSIYMSLGVMGLYSKLPCGCASVFNELSWHWHLIVNIILFSLSILGWYLTGPTNPIDNNPDKCTVQPISYKKFFVLLIIFFRTEFCRLRKIFPKKFALFPGRPVQI